MSTRNVRFCNVCKVLDVNDPETLFEIERTLDESAKELVQDAELREEMGTSQPSIWSDMKRLWRAVADSDDSLRRLCLSLAKFTRNLVANVPYNQVQAFEIEPDLRRLLHTYTSYSSLQEEESSAVTRILGQTLSNIVTANEHLLSQFWPTYMNIPEERNVLLRLLGSPRSDVVLPAEILVLNCIHRGNDRALLLTTSPIGIRICIALLDQINQAFESDSSPESSKTFKIGYTIFVRLIQFGLVPNLYQKLTVQDEAIVPHQTTLLKLLDGYLQSPSATPSAELHKQLTPFLVSTFASLSAYTQRAIRRALGSTTTVDGTSSSGTQGNDGDADAHAQQEPLKELDLLLPKVCEALVLVTQCLITVTLHASESGEKLRQPQPSNGNGEEEESRESTSDRDVLTETQSPSMIEHLIETLRLLDLFLPRINFGKPIPSRPESTTADDPKGFEYVKRDLVRLLGILAHDSKLVKDCVRSCGGIPVVMNLCVTDERNPFLREHAIFTLRNLLHGNMENQALVNEIQPIRTWDDDGQLRAGSSAVHI